MPAYIIANVEITDPSTYEAYRQLVANTIAAFGGRYLARGGRAEKLEGDWDPKRLVILEFESIERAKEWYHSAQYAPAKNLRLKIAKTSMILVEGL